MNNDKKMNEICDAVNAAAAPKKAFEKPMVELVKFDPNDVITTSGTESGECVKKWTWTGSGQDNISCSQSSYWVSPDTSR